MTEIGESVAAGQIKLAGEKYIIIRIVEVRFESGIDVYEIDDHDANRLIPPSGKPHWGGAKEYPGVYVRLGGDGETKALRVKVEWTQEGCEGSARLKGTSSDGVIQIEGEFNVGGESGEETVECQFTGKPNVVRNYGRGVPFAWEAEAGGQTVLCGGGTPLKLFFVDCRPLPISWSRYGYENHYLKIIDWATEWADGKQGGEEVFAALWDKFSDGIGARVPHATGYEYWKHGDARVVVQDLRRLLAPEDEASLYGWSCRAIAHTFMGALAIHGIKCLEVIPEAPPETAAFLVKNWRHDDKPVPNWPDRPEDYYGGSWIETEPPPHYRTVSTSRGWIVDFHKEPGVPAQGQTDPPPFFNNHWIVEAKSKLYDTSYGASHANDIARYASGALDGWLIRVERDHYFEGTGAAKRRVESMAFVCHVLRLHRLKRTNQAGN